MADLTEPVVIDKFERAPDVRLAIKAQLNRDRRPGRYVLTGSARHEVLDEVVPRTGAPSPESS